MRWDWCGQHAAVSQPVAAILRPQIQGDTLLRIVELLYASTQYKPDEMLSAIRRDGPNPFRARWSTVEVDPDQRGRRVTVPWEGEVSCGHNPFLMARRARVWPVGDGSGRVEWEDDPRPGCVRL